MPVYTVHAPPAARSAADRYTFVRDGFYVWAFVFGPLWLLAHRLWLSLLGYIAVSIGLAVTLGLLHAGAVTRVVATLVLALLLGLEAASLWRWTLSRRKWRLLDVVVAGDEEDAERRFFDRQASGRGDDFEPGAIDRERWPAASAGFAAPQRDIIGLFPQPGSPR